MMKGLLKWLGVLLFCSSLTACGGGGGGGAVVTTPTTASLTGTVTDSTLAPVAGATVRVNNGAPFTTDAAGRYNITGLAKDTALSISFAGPTPEYSPAVTSVTLSGGKTTVLDLFLTRATGQVVDAGTGGAITSQAFIDGPLFADYNLTGNELEDGAGLYTGNATLYLAPVDVIKPGHGLATFQATLGSIFPALATDAAILQTYASAGLKITDGTGAGLSLVTSPTSTLTMPIPIALQAGAPASIDLWYLDTAMGSWLHNAGETATLDAGGASYTGAVSSPGLWRAAVQRTQASSELTEITGALLFSNGSPAAGATIYLNGTDHGFQNISVTSSTGAFSLPAMTGGDFSLNFAIWANGAQWPYQQTITNLGAGNSALGNITLPYAPPTAGAAATATIMVDSRPAGNIAPNTMGYLLAAGRQISGAEDLLGAQNIADVTFLANDTPTYGEVTLTPTQAGAGIQQIVGTTFTGLTAAPVTGYFTDADLPAEYTIANLETATLPVLVAVRTAQGHFAKISIDSVTSVNGAWQITFRHAFSLSGNF